MDKLLNHLAMELGIWPRDAQEAKDNLDGSGWFYQPKTGAIKHNATRRVVHKPEWKSERDRLEKAARALRTSH